MTVRLGERACLFLATAGWHEGRRVDPEPVLTAIEAQGFQVFPALAEFIERFGGVRIVYPHFRDTTSIDGCHFDAVVAAAGIFPDVLRSWERRAGSRLAPIGEAFHGHMSLLMAPSAAVFGGMDDILVWIAPTGEDAINVLCEGREPEEIA